MDNYQIIATSEVRQFIHNLDKVKESRVNRLAGLFKTYGTFLPNKYLKKIGRDIWELRPGDVRLFLTIRGNIGFVVHAIIKKSQKIPRKDLELAVKRIKSL